MNSDSLTQAALVLKSLPKGEAAQLLSKLETEDIQAVVDESSRLDRTSPDDVLEALDRLSKEADELRRDEDRDRQILTQRISVNDSSRTKDESGPFKFLVHLAANLRHELIQDEHPENIALVLMHLPTDLASDLLKRLEPPIQVSVVRRLCEVESPDKDQVFDLSFRLRMNLQKRLKRSESNSGVRLAAQLLSCSDNDTQEKVLEYINQLDPTLVNELQESIFLFQDLCLLDNADIQVILKHVDTSFWAPALKQASLKVREKVLGNLAPRVAELLSAEIAEIGPIDNQIAAHAQSQIINVCIQLCEQGKIDIQLGKPSKPR